MLSFSDFYDIATYANVNWKGNFTEREIAENAYCYYSDYLYCQENKTVCVSITTLLNNLEEDLNNCFDNDVEFWFKSIRNGLEEK